MNKSLSRRDFVRQSALYALFILLLPYKKPFAFETEHETFKEKVAQALTDLDYMKMLLIGWSTGVVAFGASIILNNAFHALDRKRSKNAFLFTLKEQHILDHPHLLKNYIHERHSDPFNFKKRTKFYGIESMLEHIPFRYEQGGSVISINHQDNVIKLRMHEFSTMVQDLSNVRKPHVEKYLNEVAKQGSQIFRPTQVNIQIREKYQIKRLIQKIKPLDKVIKTPSFIRVTKNGVMFVIFGITAYFAYRMYTYEDRHKDLNVQLDLEEIEEMVQHDWPTFESMFLDTYPEITQIMAEQYDEYLEDPEFFKI